MIAQIPEEDPTHILVLNKYPVIPGHFILATKQNKQQTTLLEQHDLEATYSCLKNWYEGSHGSGSERLFAFFNSGEHSGASQPHRHVQFLPEEEMVKDQESEQWRMLIDLIEEQGSSQVEGELSRLAGSCLAQLMCSLDNATFISHPNLPFVHYGLRVHPDANASELNQIYHSLYGVAEKAVRRYIEDNPGCLELHATNAGSNPISYNLAMTTTFMAICPRRKEGGVLLRSDGSEIGLVALNGTVLAGTLMVKDEEEWRTLQGNRASLDKVLEAVGIPSAAIDSEST